MHHFNSNNGQNSGKPSRVFSFTQNKNEHFVIHTESFTQDFKKCYSHHADCLKVLFHKYGGSRVSPASHSEAFEKQQ